MIHIKLQKFSLKHLLNNTVFISCYFTCLFDTSDSSCNSEDHQDGC